MLALPCRFRAEKVDGSVLASWRLDMQRNEEKFTDNIRAEYQLTMAQTAKFKLALNRLRNP